MYFVLYSRQKMYLPRNYTPDCFSVVARLENIEGNGLVLAAPVTVWGQILCGVKYYLLHAHEFNWQGNFCYQVYPQDSTTNTRPGQLSCHLERRSASASFDHISNIAVH